MTTSVSYEYVEKSLYTLAAGDATDKNPLIISSALPMDYGFDSWSAATNAIDIAKCFLASWDGTSFVKLLALTDAEKEMQCDFRQLLVRAAKSAVIQKFLDTRPGKVALAYSVGPAGQVAPGDVFAKIVVSRFKSA